MLRSLLATFATALLLGTATAAPLLKRDVVVTAGIVTAGDMFEDAGTLAEEGLFRAPLPGTTGLVPLDAIKAAATRIGIDAFDSNDLLNVRVTRQAAIVDETALASLVADELKRRGVLGAGMTAQTVFTTPVSPFNAEATAEPATLLGLRYLPQSGGFTARFAIAGHDKPVDVSGAVELMVEAPFLAASLPAGAILSPGDIVMRPVSLKYAQTTGFAPLEQLVGKQLRRQSRDGMLVGAADVAEPQLVGRNDIVTIYFRHGPMTLTVKGQALTSAASGGPVQVLNLMSKRVISATVLAAGAVEVSNDPLTLAGL
jgi:flagellar basal body P-ring formation protein FlgA